MSSEEEKVRLNDEVKSGQVLKDWLTEVLDSKGTPITQEKLRNLVSNGAELQKKINALQTELGPLKDLLGSIQDSEGTPITPEKLRNLVSNGTELKKTINTLETELGPLRDLLGSIQDSEGTPITPEKLRNLVSSGAELRQKVGELKTDITQLKYLLESTQNSEGNPITPKKFQDLVSDGADLRKTIAELNTSIKLLTNQVEALSIENEVLMSAENGINVSSGKENDCWFEWVFRDNQAKEKAVYPFDIRISDNFLEVREHKQKSKSSTIDERLSNEQQQHNMYSLPQHSISTLKFDPEILIGQRTYSQFKNAFKRLVLDGDKKNIRPDKACKFTVKLWDNTGINNKKSYKSSLRKIEGLFRTYEVQQDLWPHK